MEFRTKLEIERMEEQHEQSQFGRNTTPRARQRGGRPLRRSGGSKSSHSGIQNRRRKRYF